MRIVVKMKDGIIQEILSDEEISCFVLDYDVEDLPDDYLTPYNGKEAFVYKQDSTASSAAIDSIFSAKEEKENTDRLKKLFSEE